MENKKTSYMRNFVFGVEDSLVSTVGLLSGIATAGIETKTIILAGLVLTLVEGFSMGAGSILSEHSARQINIHREIPIQQSFMSGGIMFFSYFIAGFIPLAPYIFFNVSYAFLFSIILSLIALFGLGALSGKMAGVAMARPALQTFFIGGVAIALGTFIGALFT